MNHKFLLISILLLIIPLISADRVGVIVSFPDGSVHGQCLESNENTNGYNLLLKLSLSTLWAGPGLFGHMLCQVNGVGQEVSGNFCSFTGGKFWSFYILKDNKWKSLPVGFDGGENCWNGDINIPAGDHYCVKDKDVIGLNFIEYGNAPPPVYSFNQICNPLELSDLKIYVNGKKQADADEEGGSIEAKPDSTILFKIGLENNYIFDESMEIKNIEAEITIEDINSGKDIEKKVSFKDLEVGKNDKDEISFNIPLVLEDDKYDIELKITANTFSGMRQLTIVNYDLEIDKEKHDLLVKSELQNPESCPNTNNKLNLEITNIGEKDEDVFLTIKNSDLNIDFSDSFTIDIKDNPLYKKEISFTIPSINPGDYKLTINLDYSENTKESLTLNIKDCNQLTQTSELTTEGQNIQRLGVKKAIPQQQTNYQKSFLEIYMIPVLLGVFLIFLIFSLILIIAMLNQ